ncbi:aldose 1-epimerase family protein [Terrisporobacter petrolearius]|uniref:aldose 1-epimerase family protein n=1 Tax=Terrisporobacter petrolearius TaxID=1460447 RepID=UPI003AFF97B0
MQILENNNLIIETKSSGAELTRIYSKKYKKEILWNGDKKYWRRQSPILFPIVGKLKEDKTLIEGEIYNINKHGFARDMDFDLINKDENTITYKLTSNEKTIKIYPYNFNLFISYTIVEEKVKITWNVQNIDSQDIYFSIGGHPAFNISSPENLWEYYIEFKCRKNVQKINLEGPYYSEIDEVNSLSTLKLNPGLFENDAIIYTNIDEISLKSTKEEFYINMNFKDFPLVGIWTPYYKDKNSTAPFISIEPWYGIADGIDSNKIYKNKKYINKLNTGDSFEVSYYIEVK